MIGVYSITNPKGKVYIGSSININKRWLNYFNLNCKNQPKIYNSLLKHGVENHKFKVLIECEIDELYEWEHHFSNYYKSIEFGLNCCIPPFGSVKFKKNGIYTRKVRKFIEKKVKSGKSVGGQPKEDRRIALTLTIRQSVIDKLGKSRLRKEFHAHFENETTLKKLINQK